MNAPDRHELTLLSGLERRLEEVGRRLGALERGQVPTASLLEEIKREFAAIREGVPAKLGDALEANLRANAIQLRPLMEQSQRTVDLAEDIANLAHAADSQQRALAAENITTGLATLRRDLMAIESSLGEKLTTISSTVNRFTEIPPTTQTRDSSGERTLVALCNEVAALRMALEQSRGDRAVLVSPPPAPAIAAPSNGFAKTDPILIDQLSALRKDVATLSRQNQGIEEKLKRELRDLRLTGPADTQTPPLPMELSALQRQIADGVAQMTEIRAAIETAPAGSIASVRPARGRLVFALLVGILIGALGAVILMPAIEQWIDSHKPPAKADPLKTGAATPVPAAPPMAAQASEAPPATAMTPAPETPAATDTTTALATETTPAAPPPLGEAVEVPKRRTPPPLPNRAFSADQTQ